MNQTMRNTIYTELLRARSEGRSVKELSASYPAPSVRRCLGELYAQGLVGCVEHSKEGNRWFAAMPQAPDAFDGHPDDAPDAGLNSPEGAQFEEDHLGVVPDEDDPRAMRLSTTSTLYVTTIDDNLE